MGAIDPFISELVLDEPSLRWFGFSIVEAHDGIAIVTLAVGTSHVNGNGTTHGGVVFALADQAFAMAANTVLRFAATADAQIAYLASTRVGDLLVATARTAYHDDRRAVIDVEVMSRDRTVALYRGTARALRQTQ
ncbi:MAG: hotdog fold thioesterase [Salinibacterium sp.]|nr:hotdog fold thioesterase [Salinibacterium sp.]